MLSEGGTFESTLRSSGVPTRPEPSSHRQSRALSNINYITQRGMDRILRELNWLRKDERPRITAEVSWAASLGDRSDNAEYRYGKRRLRKIDGRIHFLIGRFDNVIAVDVSKQSGDRVLFGASVLVEDMCGDKVTWRIYGEDEVNIDLGILSWRSPLARALIGKEAGDEVRYLAPGGGRSVEVLEVTFVPQEPLPEGLEGWKEPG
jgi:transcription elongation factor GreB